MSGIHQMLLGVGGDKKPLVLQYNTNVSDVTNSASYTFPAVNIGTVSPSRAVIIAVMGHANNTANVTSLTIGGIAAEMIVRNVPAADAQDPNVELWGAMVPTGTTADVVVNLSAARGRCNIGSYSIREMNADRLIPVTTGTDTDNSNPNSASVNVEKDDVLIALSAADNVNTSTWSQASENYDVSVESGASVSGASGTVLSAATRNVSNTHSASPTYHPLVVAVWR